MDELCVKQKAEKVSPLLGSVRRLLHGWFVQFEFCDQRMMAAAFRGEVR